MPITVKVATELVIADDADLALVTASRKQSQTDSVTLSASAVFDRQLGAGANEQVAFGSVVTARLVYIESKGTIRYRTGAADNDYQTIRPLVTGGTAVALLHTEAASIYLENPDVTAAVDVLVAVAGTLT